MRTLPGGLITGLTSVALSAACGPGQEALRSAAIEAFSEALTCPQERVTAAPRADLSWSGVLTAAGAAGFRQGPQEAPSAAIAADGERRARAEAAEDARQAEARALADHNGTWEVAGCEARRLVGCMPVTVRTQKRWGSRSDIDCTVLDARQSARVLSGGAPHAAEEAADEDEGGAAGTRVKRVKDGWSGPEPLQHALRKVRKALRRCPAPAQAVPLAVTITVAGELPRAAAIEAPGADEALLACIRRAVEGLDVSGSAAGETAVGRFVIDP
jgi:hypothetical protein